MACCCGKQRPRTSCIAWLHRLGPSGDGGYWALQVLLATSASAARAAGASARARGIDAEAVIMCNNKDTHGDAGAIESPCVVCRTRWRKCRTRCTGTETGSCSRSAARISTRGCDVVDRAPGGGGAMWPRRCVWVAPPAVRGAAPLSEAPIAAALGESRWLCEPELARVALAHGSPCGERCWTAVHVGVCVLHGC